MKKVFLAISLLLISHLSSAVYWQPTAQFKPKLEIAAIYIEYNDLILLLHRQDNKSKGNTWAIPGGKVDNGEPPLDAVIREVKEETGYDLSHQPIEFVKTLYIEHDETDHIVYHMFRTKLLEDPGSVRINFEEHKGFTWVTPRDGLSMRLMKDEDACFRLAYDYLLYR